MPYIDSPFTIHTTSFSFLLSLSLYSSGMVPNEKPRITEIQVRMDCNGCVQKIKRALQGIHGIYDLYIDFPQQKIIIIGWADPEKIIRAIKKTRKNATICSHTEAPDPPPAQPAETPPEGSSPTPEQANPPPPEQTNPPPAEAAPPPPPPPAEPPKDPPPQPLENPQPEAKTSPAQAEATQKPSGTKDVGEVHVIYHHPPDYAYRYSHVHGYGGPSYPPHGPGFRSEPPPPPPPTHVTHSYNAYKPSAYVTEYEYVRSPPRYTYYSRPERYSEDYYSGRDYHNNGNGNITSIFSDENPNACRIA